METFEIQNSEVVDEQRMFGRQDSYLSTPSEANPSGQHKWQLNAIEKIAVPSVPSDVSLTCMRLQELQVSRRFLIGAANKQENAARAFIRRMLGWRPDMPEKERNAIAARSLCVFAYFEKSAACKRAGKPDPDVPDDVDGRILSMSGIIGAAAAAIEPLRSRREEVEKGMIEAGKSLPVHSWAKGVKGLGPLGLAVIVSETGDLSNYPNFRHVWKRLGLMPFEGRAGSTWRLTPSKMPDGGWETLGYSPNRLAQIFSCVTDPMSKHQLQAADKSGTEFGKPMGPYGEAYVARREKTNAEHPDWTPLHARRDALRIMTKALISDLWSEWLRQHTPRLNATVAIAGAADLPHGA
jgi:Transposase IS116/IS110/IS902 family